MLKKFIFNEEGAETIEYVALLALAAILIAAIGGIAGGLGERIKGSSGKIDSAFSKLDGVGKTDGDAGGPGGRRPGN